MKELALILICGQFLAATCGCAAVDSDFDSESGPMILKLVFTAFLLDVREMFTKQSGQLAG